MNLPGSTKQEIYGLVARCTEDFCQTQALVCDSAYISGSLNISRSLASQYLNEFVRDQELIKINTRPVYFLNRRIVEESFKVSLTGNSFYDPEELTELAEKSLLTRKSFIRAIGNDTSLSHCVMQCQSAVQYPPKGLPILIWGEHGVGKSFFASLIYDYARSERLIPETACLIRFGAGSHPGDGDYDVRKLFGEAGREGRGGLLKKAAGGYLVIDHVENLSSQCWTRLLDYIKTGTFYPWGSGERASNSTSRLIFLTCRQPMEAVGSAVLQHIPIICRLPCLEERPMEDKETLVISFYRREAAEIGRKIFISNQVFNTLIHHSYDHNIAELYNCIKTSCANAYLAAPQGKKSLNVLLYHLPENLAAAEEPEEDRELEEKVMIDTATFNTRADSDRILSFFDRILNLCQQYGHGKMTLQGFMKECRESLELYYEYIIFEKKYSNAKVRSIERTLERVLDEASGKYEIHLPANCAFVASRLLYAQIQMRSPVRLWKLKNQGDLEVLSSLVRQNCETEYMAAHWMMSRICQKLDMTMDGMNTVFLALNIAFYNRNPTGQKCIGVVMAHGCCTARSIADAANKLLGEQLFDAIDMPLDISVEETARTLKQYILKNSLNRDVILLVDMGSLEEMGRQMADIPNIKIGVINNVSTGVAISIGSSIRRKLPMEQILAETCEKTVCTYRIFSGGKKKAAILITTETGETAASRVVQLFRTSLPRMVDISFIPYDYSRLAKNLDEDEVFERYNVLFVSGTLPLKLCGTAFVPLEKIIAFKDIEQVNRIFSPYFTAEELEQFNQCLLKNFSLENVMNYLTILNADKLLNFIEDALKRLENLMELRLSNTNMVGMYIHISCLVERLVTKTVIERPENPPALTGDQRRFVRLFEESFASLCAHYNVEIPLAEMLYIYGYICDSAGEP